MTDYLKPSFSVALGSKEYRDNWDSVFGKKSKETVIDEANYLGEGETLSGEKLLNDAMADQSFQENWYRLGAPQVVYCEPPTLRLEIPAALREPCQTCSEGHGDWPHLHSEFQPDGSIVSYQFPGE